MNILCIIPARGGSKGIPRKNIRLMAGKPLIFYAIDCAKLSKYNLDIYVTTDDAEIKGYCQNYRDVDCIPRPAELADDKSTLDPVINHATNYVESCSKKKYDIVITMQPTSPLLKVETFDEGIKFFIENNFDTVISGVNTPRLSWSIRNGKYIPNYEKRLNRQYMPKDIAETGSFVITKRQFINDKSRFGTNIAVYEIPENEAVDIDTPEDWYLCELGLNKKNIIIRLEGHRDIGMGHIYRGLLLAQSLIEHNVLFVLSEKSSQGIQKIKDSHFKYKVVKDNYEFLSFVDEIKPDIVINDMLDTDIYYMSTLKGKVKRIVNFEDLGNGRKFADAVINALYEQSDNLVNTYWGEDYYLIRDEFRLTPVKDFSPKVKEIVVSFGGTDPCNLTCKTLKAILCFCQASEIHSTIILGLGYTKKQELEQLVEGYENYFTLVQDVKMMTQYLSKADIAISSQGRTSLELASLAIPTILMSQNIRESNHTFGSMKNGFFNLGLGKDVEESTLQKTIKYLIDTPQMRQNMRNEMLSKDLIHGMKRVKSIIFGD